MRQVPSGRRSRPRPASAGPSLSANRAFVVQFRRGDGARAGRAEHLASGRSSHFASWEALRAFVRSTLRQLRTSPPARSQRG